MKIDNLRMRLVLAAALITLLCTAHMPVLAQSGESHGHLSFELPPPASDAEREYLGVSGDGSFTLGDIKAPIVLIEVLSVYCPYCQRSAPAVNELYEKIQGRPDLKDKIKVIGIAVDNSPYEVIVYKVKFKVPFPILSDKGATIGKMLNVPGTPTFIGVKVNGKDSLQEFMFKPGTFDDVSQFLDRVVQMAGLETTK